MQGSWMLIAYVAMLGAGLHEECINAYARFSLPSHAREAVKSADGTTGGADLALGAQLESVHEDFLRFCRERTSPPEDDPAMGASYCS